MGNLLGGGNNNGGSNQLRLVNGGGSSGSYGSSGNYGLGPELQCCDPVVDPISLLATIGAIAGLSLFLRQAVIDFMVMRRKRRNLSSVIMEGKQFKEKCNVVSRYLRNCTKNTIGKLTVSQHKFFTTNPFKDEIS